MSARPAEPASEQRRKLQARRIDALLPQTQCGKCGYAGCLPYAEAIARTGAPINRCPPGGAATIGRLAALTGRPVAPLDVACGKESARAVAWIDEARCIGCTLCIQACPVDAIVGAAKLMHTVIAVQCTGCDLCVPPCPVDCIEMRPVDEPAWTSAQASEARRRHEARTRRLAAMAGKQPARAQPGAPGDRKAVIAAALARAAAKHAARERAKNCGRGT